MKTQTKNISGQLIDINNNNILADLQIIVNLVQPRNQDEKPYYEVTATTKGYRPELADKVHILNLGNKISGEAFVYIVGIPNMTETHFTINLQNSVWNNTDWFQSF